MAGQRSNELLLLRIGTNLDHCSDRVVAFVLLLDRHSSFGSLQEHNDILRGSLTTVVESTIIHDGDLDHNAVLLDPPPGIVRPSGIEHSAHHQEKYGPCDQVEPLHSYRVFGFIGIP